ncbi:hypothetical protein PF003_g31230 [Phytophthora fragariae]|nr:hypothetical protein PF003_g38528 [Phytophthora fragariae]KAE8884773.1 hypothetical protein PF003_g31230 [Phytophthora fragariae]
MPVVVGSYRVKWDRLRVEKDDFWTLWEKSAVLLLVVGIPRGAEFTYSQLTIAFAVMEYNTLNKPGATPSAGVSGSPATPTTPETKIEPLPEIKIEPLEASEEDPFGDGAIAAFAHAVKPWTWAGSSNMGDRKAWWRTRCHR